jgi:hypothetical protein
MSRVRLDLPGQLAVLLMHARCFIRPTVSHHGHQVRHPASRLSTPCYLLRCCPAAPPWLAAFCVFSTPLFSPARLLSNNCLSV